MKLNNFLTACSLASAVSAVQKNPCTVNTSRVSQLQACSTGSSFCKSYLQGTATYTKTYTSTKTSTYHQAPTTFYTTGPTTYTYTTITRYGQASEATTTVTSGAATTTLTSLAIFCPSPNKRDVRNAAANTASCGIPTNAPAAQISAACSCLLAATTTKTVKTTVTSLATVAVTQAGPVVTQTTTSISYITPTTIVYVPSTTSTAFACSSIGNNPTPAPTFNLLLTGDQGSNAYENGYFAQMFPNGQQESYMQFPSTNHSDDFVHVFSVDSNGLHFYIPDDGGFTQDACAYESDPSQVVFIDGTITGYHKLSCAITNSGLNCIVPGDTGYNLNQLIAYDLNGGSLGIASAQDPSLGYDAVTLLAIAL